VIARLSSAVSMNEPLLEIRDVRKEYGALRPLRLHELQVAPGALVALLGLDAPAAEMFVNLVTGATLPDAGQVRVFGFDTAAITDGDEWLRTLDRFGILSDRAVLLEELTVAQNLAMTFTLAIEPIAVDVRARVVGLAGEVGIAPELLDRKVATLTPSGKLRLRLGRSVALGPDLLLMEHPTATLAREDVEEFAADLRRLAAERRMTAVAVTADALFASAMTAEVLQLQPATGQLVPQAGAWGRVKRLFGA
jgi:ABC-type transporter Mla maintaining outer membrane lipid asymmetry ATPase subunit MlaF